MLLSLRIRVTHSFWGRTRGSHLAAQDSGWKGWKQAVKWNHALSYNYVDGTGSWHGAAALKGTLTTTHGQELAVNPQKGI